MYKYTESNAYKKLRERSHGIDLCQFSMLTKHQFEHLIAELKPINPALLLDVGCGVGKIAHSIQAILGCRITAIDKDEEFIAEAKEVYGKEVDFMLADFDEMNLENSEFDVIYSVDTLYFSSDLNALVKKLFNHTKVGGKLVIFWAQVLKDDSDLQRLEPMKTNLGTILQTLPGDLAIQDFTSEEHEFWQLAYSAMQELKEEFELEGEAEFFKSFSGEIEFMIGRIKAGRISRYCYVLTKIV